MNIVKLRHPSRRAMFREGIEDLLKCHGQEFSDWNIELITERATDPNYIVLALTDSRWRVIALGCIRLSDLNMSEDDVVEMTIINPNHGQSGDVVRDIRRILRNEARNSRLFRNTTR